MFYRFYSYCAIRYFDLRNTLWRVFHLLSRRGGQRNFHSLLMMLCFDTRPLSATMILAIAIDRLVQPVHARSTIRRIYLRYNAQKRNSFFNYATNENSFDTETTEIVNYLETGTHYFACSIQTDIKVSPRRSRHVFP